MAMRERLGCVLDCQISQFRLLLVLHSTGRMCWDILEVLRRKY